MTDRKVRKGCAAYLALVLIGASLAGAPAFAAYEGSILYVTRKLKMTADEPLPPKDFYIDLGVRQGVKPGDLFEVYRRIPVVDAWTGQPQEFLRVTLGEIQVRLVGETSSVGKMVSHVEPNDLPSLDYPWFMVGDAVQSKSSLPFQP